MKVAILLIAVEVVKIWTRGLLGLRLIFHPLVLAEKKYFGDALYLNKLDVINACSF